ncbi:MAG: hypothetical protein AB1689_06780, partial [Thermodesulfobacteriota bacterium]
SASARRRRTIAAAEHFLHAGDRTHARSLLRAVLAEEPSGDERASALLLLGRIRGHEDGLTDAACHLGEALAHAVDPALRVTIALDLAFAISNVGDLGRALRLVGEALPQAQRMADPGLLAEALALFAAAKFTAGFGTDDGMLARARALEDRSRAGQLALRPSSLAGMLLTCERRLDEADALLRETSAWAADRGEEGELPFLYSHLSAVEHWRGNFAASLRYAEEALDVALQAQNATLLGIALVRRAAARVMIGDVAGARADFAEARARLQRAGHAQAFSVLSANEALLEISLGDDAALERVLASLLELVEATGVAEPFAAEFVPDAVEALARLGKVARAALLLDAFTAGARRVQRRWALAAAARSRAVLDCARGDLGAALAAADEAVARSSRLAMPVDLGRALLVLGHVRRRRGERRPARSALERAAALFRDVGAPLWCERVAEEVGRLPAARRGRTAGSTPVEAPVPSFAAVAAPAARPPRACS